MIRLPFRISAAHLKETYQKVRQAMVGNENVIFESMSAVTAGRRNPFLPAMDPREYEQKHREIEAWLEYPAVLGGIEVAMRLMEEIVMRVKPFGGVGRYSLSDLLDLMAFGTSTQGAVIFLTDDLCWAAGWAVDIHTVSSGEQRRVSLDIHSSACGEIVPSYLVRYVHSAILVYQERMYSVAIALLAIAIEATLRDVLAARGYSFDPSASSVDIFEFSKAKVGVLDDRYTLALQQPMPMSPADFSSTFGSSGIEVEIRRNLSPKKRIDLLIKAPEDFIDYWSTATIVQAKASKRVNGLGEALNIARNKEGFLSSKVLPEDFDEVIKAIRNNLVHLSGQALDTHLSMFDERSPSNRFTLQDFLQRCVKTLSHMIE